MGSVTIRPATADDHAAFARLFPLLGVDDPTPSRERWATEMVSGAYVAVQGVDVVGYVFGQVLADQGYVRNVVVAAEAQGKGVGRALMLRFAEHVRVAGPSRWMLNVKPGNAPAIALYTSLGMTRRYGSVSLRFEWPLVDGLPDADVRVEALDPADDAAFEAVTGASPGVVTASRRDRRVLLGAWRADEPVGFAVFDPEFPGAYPFRVTLPDAAGPLWRALRPHALHPYSQVVLEDDPVTAARFLAAGAQVRLHIDHYAGPLPPGDAK